MASFMRTRPRSRAARPTARIRPKPLRPQRASISALSILPAAALDSRLANPGGATCELRSDHIRSMQMPIATTLASVIGTISQPPACRISSMGGM